MIVNIQKKNQTEQLTMNNGLSSKAGMRQDRSQENGCASDSANDVGKVRVPQLEKL